MKTKKTAWFLYRPRRAEDLRGPHSLENKQAYQVTAIVILPEIDYENFSEDMLADRVFLERHADACKDGPPLSCVLVRTKHGPGGILVQPEGAFVKRAAWIALDDKTGRDEP